MEILSGMWSFHLGIACSPVDLWLSRSSYVYPKFSMKWMFRRSQLYTTSAEVHHIDLLETCSVDQCEKSHVHINHNLSRREVIAIEYSGMGRVS